MDVVRKIVYLYGSAQVNYGDVSLSAAKIEINWNTNVMTARAATDSLGRDVGVPVLTMAGNTYVTKREGLSYNFKTKKGILFGVVTQEGEGYIHGERVKKVNDNLYVSNAQYTTCNLSHPHFYINAKKLKVIPKNKIVSGPFNLVISDIPTPFGFFMGFFPVPKKEKSGLIIPTGGSSSRGFFLRQGGYYWAVNDYIGLRFVGDAYANGSWNTTFAGEYRKRYAYSGHLNFSYSNIKNTFNEDEDPTQDIHIGWQHSTLRKRNSSLSANVNINSSGFYRRNTLNPTTLQTGLFSSTILYYKNFANTPFNLNVALRQDQNILTKVMNFTLPEATLSMNRIYPFKRKTGSGQKFYERINVGYTLNTKLFITNDSIKTGLDTVLPFNPENVPALLKEADFGAQHSIPVSLTFKARKSFLKYFNFTPNFNYQEFWYMKKLDYKWNGVDSLEITFKDGFTRAFSYAASMSMSTTIYGKYKFNSKKLLGIRHLMIPSISYNYKPDFSAQGDNFVNVQVDELGNRRKLSRYASSIYGGPSSGVSNSIGFSLTNTFEAKVASKKDTITGIKKTKLIDQLSLNGSYNFTAEQNNLSLINVSLVKSGLFERFNINSTALFDPYVYKDTIGTVTNVNEGKTYTYRSNTFALAAGEGLAKLLNYNLSIGANLNPKAKTNYKSTKGSEAELQQINANPYLYVDFNMPWTLFVSYNLNYSKQGGAKQASITQSFTFNGDIKLTEKWKVGFTSGFDLVAGRFTTTRIDIYRDLHCWQMALNVIPFGSIQSYAFTINAKSSILQDLKLNKRNSTYYGGYY